MYFFELCVENSRDYVYVYNGTDDSGKLLGYHTNCARVVKFYTSPESLFVRFVTDSAGVNRGFRAVYATYHGNV